MSAYIKGQLQDLCRGYGAVSFNNKTKKENLMKELIPVMMSSQEIPHPCYLSQLRVVHVSDPGQRIMLRIRTVQ